MPEEFDLRRRKKHSPKSRVSPYTSFVLKSLTTCSMSNIYYLNKRDHLVFDFLMSLLYSGQSSLVKTISCFTNESDNDFSILVTIFLKHIFSTE